MEPEWSDQDADEIKPRSKTRKINPCSTSYPDQDVDDIAWKINPCSTSYPDQDVDDMAWKIDPCSKSYPDQDVDDVIPQSIDPSLKSPVSPSSSVWQSQRSLDVRCGQLLEITQAKLDTISLSQSRIPVEVYGEISIIQDGSELEVYDRKDDCPQLLLPMEEGRLLQLTGPDDDVAMGNLDMRVDIRNKATGAVIVKGSESFHLPTSEINPDWEKVNTLKFNAPTRDVGLVEDGGSLEIEYVALTYGVYALIQVYLCKEGDIEGSGLESGLEVYGDITAECELLSSPRSYKTYLLHVVKDEYEWMGFEDEILLSKRLVGVPAYSHLRISVHLKNNENDKVIVWGEDLFEASNFSWRYGNIGRNEGNDFYAKVVVHWCKPPMLNKPCKVESIGRLELLPSVRKLVSRELLEVFSIFIHVPRDYDYLHEVKLYGYVEISDSRGLGSIFRLSGEEAYLLPPVCCISLPLKGPDRASPIGDNFSVNINLNNVDDNVHIKGSLQSCAGLREREDPWLDKFLCSVVVGTDDRPVVGRPFAAIHYAVFSSAVEAKVTIRFVLSSLAQARFKVYGNLIAFYDKFTYSNHHEEQYYRKKLFDRDEHNAIESAENLQLSREWVAVPSDNSLLLEINLSFLGNQGLQGIMGTVKFRIGEESQVIKQECMEVHIDVKWSPVRGMLSSTS